MEQEEKVCGWVGGSVVVVTVVLVLQYHSL